MQILHLFAATVLGINRFASRRIDSSVSFLISLDQRKTPPPMKKSLNICDFDAKNAGLRDDRNLIACDLDLQP
jgi:hypothetical protein